jgi:thiol-disulfide isomerase/thioredoxin
MRGYLLGMLCALAACFGTALAGAAEKVHTFEANKFKQIVADHKGNPFVIVVWSLDCAYCLPSFEALAEAQRRRPLVVVTIATDRASDAEAVSFIEKKIGTTGLVSDTWAFGTAPAEQLRFAIDPKWRGEMPRSYWFDSQVNAVAHSGVITKENIAELGHVN